MITGTVHRYGDNIDTDVIIPARYLNAPSPEELAKHCMEDIDPSFVSTVRPGDIMVGGWNFGCGSSRENLLLSATLALLLADRGSVKSHALRLQITGA